MDEENATLVIDGSQGEGGGQILRSSFALAALLGRKLRVHSIRAGRAKPGLKRQHLTCVRAAAEVCGGRLRGDEINGSELHFEPGEVRAGDYHFAVGSAGSACLVFQTVLWPLLFARGDSRVVFEGGTHNSMSPSFDFIARSFLPVLKKMGARVSLRLERHGFVPAGGGRFVAEIAGDTVLKPISLCELGPVRHASMCALVSKLPASVGRREVQAAEKHLQDKVPIAKREVREVEDSPGPGNVFSIELERGELVEHIVEFGARERRAEKVGRDAAKRALAYLRSKAPVGEHLADQLLIPMALAAQNGEGGAFRTAHPSEHTLTNADIVGMFLTKPEQHSVSGEVSEFRFTGAGAQASGQQD